MSDLNQLWKETPAAKKKTEFDPIPEGKYMAYVDRVKYDETKTPNVVSIWWKILGPSQKNRIVFATYKMDQRLFGGIGDLKKDLATLGTVVLDPSKLMEFMESLVGQYGKIRVYHSQGKDKLWVNMELLEKASKSEMPEFDDEEQIPF